LALPALIVHAIVVLGVKVKPASPVAPLRCANLDSSARRRRFCYRDLWWQRWPLAALSPKATVANKPRRPIAVTCPERSGGSAIAPRKSTYFVIRPSWRYAGLTAIGRRGAESCVAFW